ncbi:IclR family transcriptional regulator domain-containing protein [Arthrobacter mobilis]|uniref:Glycerol operon regulatory protein n=1 Tax=Arthrobacter mobilis TaxID=2724944 RepID=A0A7X6K5K5_9MICC|nr:IclR family transcriptional regulator C-terminal domain-containing protein [Arthrobacter mobilis]NKX53558.1 helix-turn-helix domain-containing protein [Arthrobacter mobilis]
MTETKQPGDQFVQSLARGLAVIRAFDAENVSMTLSDVSRRTGLTRATARRFLHTLVELGYVRTDGRVFELTALVLQLGYSYLSGQTLPQLVQPLLEELSAQLHESTSASILDGADIVYIARIHTRRIMTVGITVGTRFPAYATSMGRVLLAGLPEPELERYLAAADLRPLTPRTIGTPDVLRAELARIRRQGYAVVDQELETGLRSVAVPIHAPDGSVAAALNVSMQVRFEDAGRNLDDLAAEVLPQLQAASRKATDALRAKQEPRVPPRS